MKKTLPEERAFEKAVSGLAEIGVEPNALQTMQRNPWLVVRLHQDYETGQLYEGELQEIGAQISDLLANKQGEEREETLSKLDGVFAQAEKQLARGNPIKAIGHLTLATYNADLLQRASASTFSKMLEKLKPVAKSEQPPLEKIAEARKTFDSLGVPRYGALARNAGFFVALHELIQNGAVEKNQQANLKKIGLQLANLFKGKPQVQVDKLTRHLDSALTVAHRKLQVHGASEAINHLLKVTRAPESLVRANALHKFELVKLSRPSQLIANRTSALLRSSKQIAGNFIAREPSPLTREEVEQAIETIKQTRMPRYGALRGHPGIIFAMHRAINLAQATSSRDASEINKHVKEIGQHLTRLVQPANEETKQLYLKPALDRIERTARKTKPIDVLRQLNLAMQSTENLQRAARGTKLQRFKETRAGKALFAELRFPRRGK